MTTSTGNVMMSSTVVTSPSVSASRAAGGGLNVSISNEIESPEMTAVNPSMVQGLYTQEQQQQKHQVTSQGVAGNQTVQLEQRQQPGQQTNSANQTRVNKAQLLSCLRVMKRTNPAHFKSLVDFMKKDKSTFFKLIGGSRLTVAKLLSLAQSLSIAVTNHDGGANMGSDPQSSRPNFSRKLQSSVLRLQQAHPPILSETSSSNSSLRGVQTLTLEQFYNSSTLDPGIDSSNAGQGLNSGSGQRIFTATAHQGQRQNQVATPESPSQRRARYDRTAEELSKSGLMDVTLKTADLVKRNAEIQKEIDELKKETAAFVADVMNNPENQWLKQYVQVKPV